MGAPEDRIHELEAENATLREQLQKIRWRREAAAQYGARGIVWLLAGPRLYGAIRRSWDAWSVWLSHDRVGPWPEAQSRDLLASIASRLTRAVTIGGLVAVLPILVLILQTRLLHRQTQLLSAQNDRLDSQNRLTATQNEVLERQLLVAAPPSLRIEPFGFVEGQGGVFKVRLVNHGLSALSDVGVYTNFFLGSRGSSVTGEPPLTLEVTVLHTMPSQLVEVIPPDSDYPITIDMNEGFSNFEGDTRDRYRVLRLRVDYRREVDDMPFTLVKGYMWSASGSTLLDLDLEGNAVMPDFQYLRAVLHR